MSAVSTAREEIQAAQVALAEPHEGLRDFAALDLTESAKVIVNAAVLEYDQRRDLLKAAKDALDALIADGYPDVPVMEIPAADYNSLQENASSINAALAKFRSTVPASTLGLTPGPTQPK